MAQTAVALSPINVSAYGATFRGVVNPDGVASFAWFEYGLTTAYGATTTPINVGAGSSDVPISEAVGGLLASLEYHYRVALNAGTPPTPPSGDFGGTLASDAPRIDDSTGSVINVTTAAQLETALATCAFGSIIDCGDIPMTPSNGYYFLWNRNGNGVVTTVRNGNFVNGYMQIQKGSWFRLEDSVSTDSLYFGFKAEGGNNFEILRCQSINARSNGYMLTVASDGTPSINWQIWDSYDYHCGYGPGSTAHSIYAETHNAQCVIANHLSVAPNYFGFHVSTDRTAAQNPYVDGLIVTGCTQVDAANRSSIVLYGTNQANHGQRNCKFVGIISQNPRNGIIYCYPPLASNNRMYGCVEFDPNGSDYQLANVAPVYYNGVTTVSGVVTADPDLDGTYHPSGSSSAKGIVPAAQWGLLPEFDRDGVARVTADAGCYAVP